MKSAATSASASCADAEWPRPIPDRGGPPSAPLARQRTRRARPFARSALAPPLSAGDTDGVFASIRAAVAAVDPRLPVRSLTTFGAQIARSLTTERALATLSSGFGLIALLIAVIGLYGVMAFVALQRTPEIGVRLALGARRSAAIWLVVRHAVRMVGVGMIVALPAAFALRRLIEAELFGVRAFDGPTIVTATALLGLVALAAALLPAWRASRMSPNALLKAE